MTIPGSVGRPAGAVDDDTSAGGLGEQARQRAAKQLEPESVAVKAPSATIKTNQDLDSFVDELRARVQPHLDDGKTVII